MDRLITIRTESEEEMSMIKALMLSLEISFKVEESYTCGCELKNEAPKGSHSNS